MNVIIANEAKAMLSTLDIDVIKSVDGVHTADEIVEMFKNFFYARMILDITAIKDYEDITNIQKISIGLDADKIILVLPNNEASTSSSYLSKIISMGIYNFTTTVDGVKYFLEHPNTYKDVAHIQQLNDLSSTINEKIVAGSRIIGIKNVTDHAGSTTLIYMLKKELEQTYGMSVVAIEVNKHDILYFNSHNITDGIRKIYIDKFNKSLLDDNNDMLILENLSNGTNYLSLEKEHITKVHKLETLESDKLNKEEELKILNEIIIRLKTLIEMIDYNHEVTRKLYVLEERLSNLPIFSKEKRNIKDNIIQLKSTLLNFDKNIEKSRIKKEYLDKYASVYGDLKGLSYMFDTFSLGELIHIFNSIYESKVNIYNEELEKIKVLRKEIKKYREIDFEDLYERLEGLDGNNKKHN